ncbi:solute carrier family 23 protein [Cupriavidus basilensis]
MLDATGTIRAVGRPSRPARCERPDPQRRPCLTTDSLSSIFSAFFGGAPAAALHRIEPLGVAAGAKTGLAAVVVGLLFLAVIFFRRWPGWCLRTPPLPALMYVGLLMLSSVEQAAYGRHGRRPLALVCAVFIVLTCNIVTGIMLGFCTPGDRPRRGRRVAQAECGHRQHRAGTGRVLRRRMGHLRLDGRGARRGR